MTQIAIQDLYPEEFAHCFGCGTQNSQGHGLKTYLKGDITVSTFTPDAKYTALPGSVYGGLIASLLDCHGTASAAAFASKANGKELDKGTLSVRCVTGNLNVNFKKATPMGQPLTIVGKLKSIDGRKVTVAMDLFAMEELCATGEILAITLK
ncbi:PaaI family thioesterase [Myroides sp. LJL115]